MERYIKLLEKAGISTYLIRRESVISEELFFIKKKLDMRRMKDATKVNIALFKDIEDAGTKKRGRADVIVYDDMSDEEILSRLSSGDYAATFAMNPYYPLPQREVSKEIVTKSSLNDYSLTQITDLFVKALYEEDCNEKAFINNFELFVEETSVKIVSSNGTDVAYKNREVKGEFVTQCKHPVDVETYQNFAYDSLALENFKDLVRTALKMSEDRSLANVMPKAGNTNIILSDKYMKDFIGFYAGRADAAYIYQKYSNYEIGKDVQGNDTTGDRLNIQFGVSKPFSNEGVRMSKRPLLENGVVKTIHGGMRFCHYLGVEQIGTYEKVLLPAGRVSLDEMKKGPCLHIVNFSD